MKRVNKYLAHLEEPSSSLGTVDVTTGSVPSSRSALKLSRANPSAYQSLIILLGPENYSEAEEDLEKYGSEVIASLAHGSSHLPQAVVFPRSTEDVRGIVHICSEATPEPVPLICYSGGTSLESHIVCVGGRGITISFSKMNAVLSVDAADMQCTVQPGVNWNYLNSRVLKKKGLFLGVDPSPAACIGGMVGTCCSGPLALKHGTMTNNVISLTVVLADGRVIKTAQSAWKSVAGYNLTALFVGSEGTLGIVTEIVLRLRPVPTHVQIAQAFFDDLDTVAKCQREVLMSGVSLAAFEFMDDKMVEASIKYERSRVAALPTAVSKKKKKTSLPEQKSLAASMLGKHMIIFKFAGATKEHVTADIRVISQIVKKHSRYAFVFSATAKERRRLWAARKAAFWAAKYCRSKRDAAIVTDVAVPFSKLSIALSEARRFLNENNVIGPIVAHIGDGNFHIFMVYNPHDEDEKRRAQKVTSLVVESALKLGGTCTGEHGVGVRKKKYLRKELGDTTVDFMTDIKRFVDSKNILNPHKVVDATN